ncbi:MAG: hypothetical protein K1X71_01940 [Pirellulales bacterium]|nr:hypothetical protein [Pirellulales bacterium]
MLSRHRWWLWALVALLACRGARAEEGVAEQTATGHKFLRLTRDDDGNLISMDTSVVSYQPAAGQPAGLVVDLIGAVHIGERPYYEELNKLFADYDVVLYELVAPKGTRVPKGGRGRDAHPVSMLQSGMKDMLGLESQVELIDYQKENLVHADMSPEDFAESMEKKGDNFFVLFFRMMGRSLAQQSKQQVLARDGKARQTNDADMLLALFDPNRSHKLKQIMAEQFEGMDGMMEAIEGPDGSTIISERNKVALAGLKEQIAAGKKRIGIFYGAGHMPDMEQRLIEDFGLRRGDERWLTAWNLNEQPAAEKSEK